MTAEIGSQFRHVSNQVFRTSRLCMREPKIICRVCGRELVAATHRGEMHHLRRTLAGGTRSTRRREAYPKSVNYARRSTTTCELLHTVFEAPVLCRIHAASDCLCHPKQARFTERPAVSWTLPIVRGMLMSLSTIIGACGVLACAISSTAVWSR